MKKILHTLFVVIFVCFSSSMYGMEKENLIQPYQVILPDLVAPIARYCKPRVKNILMKVCKTFNTQLQNKELIVQANPFTVSRSDIARGMFVCTYLGDANKLRIWLNTAKATQVSIDSVNILHKNLYQVVSKKNHEEIMALLVEYDVELFGINYKDLIDNAVMNLSAIENLNSYMLENAEESYIKTLEEGELCEAVYWGDKKCVQELLESDKVDPNVVFSSDKMTPLCIAAHEGHTDIVQLLIDAQARVNKRTWNGKSPLCFAVQKGRTEIVRLLLKHGSNIVFPAKNRSSTGLSALSIAAENGHAEIVDLLLRDKPGINEIDSHSLSLAVQRGHTKVAKLLIGAGVNVNYVDMINDGHNLLYLAAENGHVKMVDLLLIHIPKVHINAVDKRRSTPLCVAIKQGNIAMVKSLLAAGAERNTSISAGHAPLHIAIKKGCIEIVKLLLSSEVGTHQKVSHAFKDAFIKRALSMAEEFGHMDIVKFLQEYLAIRNNMSTVELLQEYLDHKK